MSYLVAIPPDQVGTFWDDMQAGLADVLAKGINQHEPDEVRTWLDNGSWLLFAQVENARECHRSVTAGRLQAYFICKIKRQVFEIGMCWGSAMDEWMDETMLAFETIARQCGCTNLVIAGRPGWAKLGKSRGFKTRVITIVKELK
jgi:hypothetical protein